MLLPSGKIKYLLRLDSVVEASIAFSDTQMARKWRHAKTRKRSRMPCIPRAPPRCDSHAFRCTMGRPSKGEKKEKKNAPTPPPPSRTKRRRIVSANWTNAIRLERCPRTDRPRSTGNTFPEPRVTGTWDGSNEQTLATRSTIRSANNICMCMILYTVWGRLPLRIKFRLSI